MPLPLRVLSRASVALGVVSVLAINACSDRPLTERLSAPTTSRASVDATNPGVVPGQYIVVFKSGVHDAPGLAGKLVAAHGGDLRFFYSHAFSGFAASLSAAAADALKRNPNIERIEPDASASAMDVESPVPTWGLDRIDQPKNRLDKSYTYVAQGGAGVNVYIIDTGIRTTHTEFGGRAVGAFTTIDDGNGTNDCYGHGTYVAGTVGGTKYGVAKRVRLYAVRVLPCDGVGDMSDVVAGLDWVAQNRVLPAVVNLSLSGDYTAAVNQAIEAVVASGVTVVVAAGNNGADACGYSPASAGSAITVGASTSDDLQAPFSNWGSCLDIYAPGVNILSASAFSDTTIGPKSGTSLAAPHVTGAAALFLSVNPLATPDHVAGTLLGGATRDALTGLGVGSANRLLFTGAISGIPDTIIAPSPGQVTDYPPSASFSSTCLKTGCRFDASSSSDDIGIVNYNWNFGDGTPLVTATSPLLSHSYPSAGSYAVVLTVTDSKGQNGQLNRVVRTKRP